MCAKDEGDPIGILNDYDLVSTKKPDPDGCTPDTDGHE